MKENTPTQNWLKRLPISTEKKFWNADKVVSLSAFVVSIATLLALMYQIRLSGEQNKIARQQQELIRKEQYASVLPYLEVRVGTNNGNRLFELLLLNNGVGPAFIVEVRAIYNHRAYPGDAFSFYRRVILEVDTDTTSIPLGTQRISEGQVIPAGEKVAMLTAYDFSSSVEERDRLVRWFGRTTEGEEAARIEVVYASVYGERWIIRGIGSIPESIPTQDAE